MMIKTGDLTENSASDTVDPKTGQVKRAEYFDDEGFGVVSKEDVNKLKKPVKIGSK
jgi:hypothetical protein